MKGEELKIIPTMLKTVGMAARLHNKALFHRSPVQPRKREVNMLPKAAKLTIYAPLTSLIPFQARTGTRWVSKATVTKIRKAMARASTQYCRVARASLTVNSISILFRFRQIGRASYRERV